MFSYSLLKTNNLPVLKFNFDRDLAENMFIKHNFALGFLQYCIFKSDANIQENAEKGKKKQKAFLKIRVRTMMFRANVFSSSPVCLLCFW